MSNNKVCHLEQDYIDGIIKTNGNTHAKICYDQKVMQEFLKYNKVCNLYGTNIYDPITGTPAQKKLNKTPCTDILGYTWEKKNPKCTKNCRGDNYITCGNIPNCTGKVFYDTDKKVGAIVNLDFNFETGILELTKGYASLF